MSSFLFCYYCYRHPCHLHSFPTRRSSDLTLARKGYENDPAREGSYRFLTTGDPDVFREMGVRFLQLPVAEVEHVELADRKSTRLNSSHTVISYAVFCLKKKTKTTQSTRQM